MLLYTWPLKPGRLGRWWVRYLSSVAPLYFPVTIVVEDGAEFQKDKSYIVGEGAYSPVAVLQLLFLRSPCTQILQVHVCVAVWLCNRAGRLQLDLLLVGPTWQVQVQA